MSGRGITSDTGKLMGKTEVMCLSAMSLETDSVQASSDRMPMFLDNCPETRQCKRSLFHSQGVAKELQGRTMEEISHVSALKIGRPEPREMTQSIKYLQGKEEDMSLIPGAHIERLDIAA